MLKKVVAFQRLFFASKANPRGCLPAALVAITFGIGFILITTLIEESWMLALLAALSIQAISQILNGSRMFEIVPVSRMFTVLNIYLAAIAFTCGIFVSISVLELVLRNYLNVKAPLHMAPMLQGNLFMLLALVIVLFVCTTIALIRNKALRISLFIVFFFLCNGLLAVLKRFMPAEDYERTTFLERLAIMPHATEIVAGLGIATLIIVPLSVYVGYKLYLPKPGLGRRRP